jgi:hypothetical protein
MELKLNNLLNYNAWFTSIVDDLMKAFEQQTWCKFHLMSKLKGT